MSNKLESQQIAKEILISLIENKILNEVNLKPRTEAAAQETSVIIENIAEHYETIQQVVEKQRND